MGDNDDTQQRILVDILKDPSVEAKELPFSLLVDITENFSAGLELGHGTYGTVYKGVLQKDVPVAVKRLHPGQVLDDNGFYAEVNSMKKLSNKNVIRLLGYCLHTETEELMYNGERVLAETRRERLLCLEYVPNGQVKKAGAPGDEVWFVRYEMIKGICNGLEYIHDKGYIHLDLKPTNILLDESMVPKITDFGTSRFFGDQRTRETKNKPGTYGYMAPEYIHQGTVSKKADMFSLGVVMLELLTGSKGPEYSEEKEKQKKKEIFLEKVLFHWNRRLCRDLYRGSQLELAYQQVETCVKIALKCTDDNRDCRGTTKEVSQILDLVS